MSQWHGGKGSKRRNANDKAYSDNWDKIFKKEIKMKVEIYGKSRCTYCDAAKNISKQRNIDMLKCDISCPRQWDTISLDSSRKLTYLISNDLDYIINREQL